MESGRSAAAAAIDAGAGKERIVIAIVPIVSHRCIAASIALGRPAREGEPPGVTANCVSPSGIPCPPFVSRRSGCRSVVLRQLYPMAQRVPAPAGVIGDGDERAVQDVSSQRQL